MTKEKKRLRAQAFSLVEAIAFICIISILASGSMLILSGTLSHARIRASVRVLLNLHQKARRESRETTSLVCFDLDRQEIEFQANGRVDQKFVLPASVRITKLAVGGAVFDLKQQRIDYRNGGCETYAILVGSVSARKKWYVFNGSTDNVEVFDDEETTEASLVQWQTRWANTN